jgi:hypothetical protein
MCEFRIGGWLTLDPLGSSWVPHPFTNLVKGAGVELTLTATFHPANPL